MSSFQKINCKGFVINYRDDEHSEFRMTNREISNKEVAYSLIRVIEEIVDNVYGEDPMRFVMAVSRSHNTSIVFEVWADPETDEIYVRTKTRMWGNNKNTLHRHETIRVEVA